MLVEDWCQQHPSHSIGTLEFDSTAPSTPVPEKAQASPSSTTGRVVALVQLPSTLAATLPFLSARRRRRRLLKAVHFGARTLRTTGDPVNLAGTVIRVDPTTGNGLPNNPLAGSADPNARRIIADGLRNPFRFTFRPGTTEIWIGDVGWNEWEEINRIVSPTDSDVENFGWPCYEGIDRQPGYDAANLNICESLYATGTVTPPFFRYSHSAQIVPGENCVLSPTEGSSSPDFRCRVRVLYRRVIPGVVCGCTLRRLFAQVYLGNQDGIAGASPASRQSRTSYKRLRDP